MRNLKVLVGCEVSGAVRRAFRALGHNAWSCDVKPSEERGSHIMGDIFNALEGDAKYQAIGAANWDLAIFFPPCTYLNSAGLHWNKRGRDPQLTVDALVFVHRLLNCGIRHIALENPVGCISTRIRPASQYIQPFNFGEDASKKTGLWLNGLPLLTNTKFVPPRMVCECGNVFRWEQNKNNCPKCGEVAKPRWGNQTDSGQNKLGPSETRAADRAITYPGIAQAMAQQWSQYLCQ